MMDCAMCNVNTKMEQIFINCEDPNNMFIEENTEGKTFSIDTHSFIWVCEDCPNITFEYVSEKDLKALNWYLGRNQ